MSVDSRPLEILIVDDEPSVRMLLKRWIQRSMHANVLEAGNGLEALEQIAQGEVEMVVSDINMPVLNGIEMLSLLQADPSRKRLELLIASQVSQEGKVSKAIELGVSDYLLKPLQHDRVIERLKHAAERIYERRKNQLGVDSGARMRVLVADPDPNYCALAESALAADFQIQSARSVAETLVRTLRFRPDLILLNPRLSGLDIPFLFDRLAALPGHKPPMVYLLSADPDERSVEGIDGVVVRSFVPENLQSDLVGLLRNGHIPEHGVLAWAASLGGEMTTALYQTLGMLTGVEPHPAEEPETAPAENFGWIEITADGGDFSMRLEVACGADLPEALTSGMLGGEKVETPESMSPLDGLSEVLNVIAGRLKNSCLERQIEVSSGLPVTGTEPPPPRRALVEHEKWFRWGECAPFRLKLDARPSRAKPAAQQEPTATAGPAEQAQTAPEADEEPSAAEISAEETAIEQTPSERELAEKAPVEA